MKSTRNTNTVSTLGRQLLADVRAVWPDARRALRKPAVVGQIVLTAHQAQVVLGVLLLVMLFLAPVVVHALTSFLFPPETANKVFGLIKTKQASPWADTTYTIVMAVLWTVSVAATWLLAWFHIPRGIARAEQRSHDLSAHAETLEDPAARTALYRKALAMTLDSDFGADLRDRMNKTAAATEAKASSPDTLVATNIEPAATAIDSSSSNSATGLFQSQPSLSERYTLGQELGKGAMGVVYGAHDRVLDRQVAIKQLAVMLTGDEMYAARFRQEAKALARLTHPNVVQVYDLIEDGHKLWMVLEFVDGGDLASYLKERGQLAVDDAVAIAISMATGLAYAHAQGIVHRDLKPANVLLTRDRQPKISDFGIAKLSQSSSLTQTGSVMGSPPYMSPEQCSGGSIDHRTDIYALGITLYELLSGKVPFEGDTSSVMARQIIEQPAPLTDTRDDISSELQKLVTQMLAKDPNERPADMNTVAELLSQIATDVSSSKRPDFSHNAV